MAGIVWITEGTVDYVKDGTLYRHQESDAVMVESADDLEMDELADYAPGTLAFTAGYQAVWQMAADGTWADLLAEAEETDEDEPNAGEPGTEEPGAGEPGEDEPNGEEQNNEGD